MSGTFSNQLASLLKMRTTLIWAQVRGNRYGAFLLALVLLGFAYVAYGSLFTGVGVVLADLRLQAGQKLIGSALTFAYFFAVGMQIVLGRGSHALLTDRVLRAYPMSYGQRAIARELCWFFDPVWLAVGLFLIGISFGAGSMGIARIWLAVPGSILLLICMRETVHMAHRLMESLLSSARGTSFLAGAGLLVLSAGMLSTVYRLPVLPWIGGFPMLPPGAAAVLLSNAELKESIASLLVLGCWIGALFHLSRVIEGAAFRGGSRTAAGPNWIGRLLLWRSGSPEWAMAFRSLAYNLRNARVRLSLALAPTALFGVAIWTARRSDGLPLRVCLVGTFSAVGFCATRALALNQFGYDGPGLLRHWLLPVPLRSVIRAAALVSLALSIAMTIPALVVAAVLDRSLLTDPARITVLALSSMAGSFLFQAAGLFTSVLSPRTAEFRQMFGNDMTLAGNAVMYASMLLSFGMPLGLSQSERTAHLLDNGPAFLVLAIVCGVVYLCSLKTAGVLWERRWRQIAARVGA